MAGDIFVSKDQHWTVASWAFYWAAEFLISNLDDEEAVAWIKEVVDEHIMVLNLDADFSKDARKTILSLLANELVPDAAKRLPTDDFDREAGLETLQQLAGMARDTRKRPHG